MAEWTTAYVNDLPDSAFACVDAGGSKDEQGKTVPRSLRHYPHHDASGKVDPEHLANGRARVRQELTTSCGRGHLFNEHTLPIDEARSMDDEDQVLVNERLPTSEYLVRATFPGPELRADEGAAPRMFGHLALFNEWAKVDSVVEGRFMERVAPGAFSKTISENRRSIQPIYDHGRDVQFGRRPLGKIIELREDERGVYYEVELLDTPLIRGDLLPGLKSGVYGSSFKFRPTKRPTTNFSPPRSAANSERWPEVTVHELEMIEFGPTPFPIYAGATAGARSLTDELVIAGFAQDPAYLRSLISAAHIALPDIGAEPAHSDARSRDKDASSSPAPVPRFRSRKEWLEWISRS